MPGIGFALIAIYVLAAILASPTKFSLHAFLEQYLLVGRVVIGDAEVLATVPGYVSANRKIEFAQQHLATISARGQNHRRTLASPLREP